MRKVSIVSAVLMCGLAVMGGCQKEQPKVEEQKQVATQPAIQVNAQVKEDLAKYRTAVEQAMKPWSAIDRMTEDLKKAKTAKIYVGKLHNEFMPLVTGVLTKMEAIKPATKEVQSIHDTYKANIKEYVAALQEMAEAVEKNNEQSGNVAAAKLNAFPAVQSKLRADIEALTKSN